MVVVGEQDKEKKEEKLSINKAWDIALNDEITFDKKPNAC